MYGEVGSPNNFNSYGSVPTTGIPIGNNDGGWGNNNYSNYPPPPPPPHQQQSSASPWAMPPNQNMQGFPPSSPPPPSSVSGCTYTSAVLDQHLRESGHGANQAAFNCYFVPGVMPPRCAFCQRMIAEHAPSVVMNGGGFTTAFPALLNTNVVGNRPKIDSNGSVDTYIDSGLLVFRFIGLLLLVVGISLFIAFGATFDPNQFGAGVKFIAPSILTFMGCVFTLVTKRITLSFDKQSRQVKYNSSRIPWICCSKSSSFGFGDIVSVSVQATNVSINHVAQCEVVLKIRSGEDIQLGMCALWSAESSAAGWRTYLREIGCTIQ